MKNDDKAFSHLLLVLAALSLHGVRLSRVLCGSLRCRRARLGTKPGESISLPVSLRFPRLTCRLVLCSDSCCTSPDSWLSCWRGCGPLPPALSSPRLLCSIGRQILVDIFTISAAKHILWQLVWEKKHILLLCSMLHESGYP